MKKFLTAFSILLVIILVTGCSMIPTNLNSSFEKKADPTLANSLFDYENLAYQQGQVLLYAVPDISLNEILDKEGSEVLEEWPEIGWTLVSVPQGETEISFINKMKDKKGILLAEPNLIYELDLAPVGEDYKQQWAFNKINAEAAWDITTGSEDVIVAIVDTGVQIDHPEFADKEFIAAFDVTGDGYHGELMHDINGHGTHVAGIAADNGNSGEITGVAWDCPIMPVRVMDDNRLIYNSYLIKAMLYLGNYAQNHTERIVANMSIGGRGYSFAFKDAIDYAAENGVLLITSAGNDSKRVLSYPSAYNGVVSVAASDPYDKKAYFSTTGWWNSVAAPGVKILSTYPDLDGYEYLQGTSMASPYVTGAAALLLSYDPTLSPLEIKNQIEQSAYGDEFTEELGYGILDLEALLTEFHPMTYGSLNVTTNIISNEEIGWIGTGVITVFDAASDILVSFGTTGIFGNYLFQALKPGTYDVNISYYDLFNDNYVVESKQSTIYLGQESTLDFDLPVPSSIDREIVLEEDIIEPEGWVEIPITITEDSFYEIETSCYHESCDTVLYLYDGEGHLLAQNDDHLDIYSYIGKELTSGDYKVIVEEFNRNPLDAHLVIYKTTIIY